MTDIEQIMEKYFVSTCDLLHEHPDKREIFEELWDIKEFRRAYVFVIKVVEQFHITRSEENLTADQEFFWAYMH